MSPKRILLVGTMALTISISGGIWDEDAKNAGAALHPYDSQDARGIQTAAASKDTFLSSLGATKDEEVYEALYDGRSLADIAAANHTNINRLIDQQIQELTAQLDERLKTGMIQADQYEAYKAELADIVTQSAHGSSVA